LTIALKDRKVTKRRNGKTDQARRLRRAETAEEILLWGELRNRLLNGYKFTRQVPLGPYVVDFLCRENMLVVELDGGQHAESDYDMRRTEWLNHKGYSVLRFWNHEVMRERRAVLDTILAVLTGEIFARDEAIRFFPSTMAKDG
jgi:very-short-patch-repair endonuclease